MKQTKHCIECGKKLNSNNELDYCTKHRMLSPQRKKYTQKYLQSDKYKVAVKKYVKKYFQSDKGKAALKRYQQSDKGKATYKKAKIKYKQSARGKERIKKANRKYYLKKKKLQEEKGGE